MAIKPVPEGFHTITPYLTVKDANSELDFIKKAFKAKEHHIMRGPDGSIGHADLVIGDSHVMMGQARGEWTAMPGQLYLYVPDCDASYRQALAAGATSVQEPKTQFYGDRQACVKDCCDNLWWIATHVEDVSDEELQRRMKAERPQG
jgi:PhnB protein